MHQELLNEALIRDMGNCRPRSLNPDVKLLEFRCYLSVTKLHLILFLQPPSWISDLNDYRYVIPNYFTYLIGYSATVTKY